LKEKGIPTFYLQALGVMAFFLILLGGWMARIETPSRSKNPWILRLGFFSMGAAFLLLESKSIVQFSLLYGTTWWNSSIVFLTVMLLVLAANRAAVHLPAASARTWIPVLLLLSCLMGFLFPISRLLYLENPVLRLALAGVLMTLPVFFANLLFSVKFRDSRQVADLFGWNLLGSATGGILEYSSMVWGYNALALVVVCFYSLAIWMFSKGKG